MFCKDLLTGSIGLIVLLVALGIAGNIEVKEKEDAAMFSCQNCHYDK